ncbi:MAG: selenocysteine-specific translation elongation factor [Phycisphaerae bacterium]|nr:selenocysteine-specific translation elongation factor [Phycisphaerae bacterium]
MSRPRKHIMLGTAGHVDHGKTALVKLLTGCDTDRLAIEKLRGLTIELGFAPCAMRDGRIVGIVDVPGHADFIRNMVAGACGIDVVILVVAADDGVMPQTREHLDILTLMGVRRGVVALTKCDLVDKDMLHLVDEEVRAAIASTFLRDAPICPLSNVTGEGFEAFLEALDAAASACQERPGEGLFRLWIERVFNVRGFGAVVSGIASRGQVRVGDRLHVTPGGHVGRVRRLEVYGQEDSVAQAGECVALNLADVPDGALTRGVVLSQRPTAPVSMAEAELHLVAAAPEALADYAHVHLHVGTAEAMAHVAVLDAAAVQPGRTHLVQLRLDDAVGVVPGERFVIRGGMASLAGGHTTTLGGGRILDTSNVRLRRNRPWTLAALSARAAAIDDPARWCLLHLAEAKGPLDVQALADRAQQPTESVQAFLTAAQAEGKASVLPNGTWVHSDVIAGLARRITETLEKFHTANPARLGLGREVLADAVEAHPGALELALARLLAERTVRQQGQVLALAGRESTLSGQDEQLCQQIASALQSAGLAPPAPAELAESLGVAPPRVAAMIRVLADAGTLVELDEKVVMHRDAVDRAKLVALELFAQGPRFTTMAFRDALVVSRKYAVPLLDYLDKARFTVRSGSTRTPGVEARKRL